MGRKFSELLKVLDENVDLVYNVKNWEEAVKISGELLLRRGCIEPKYIKKMIETCKELGPYIAISPGIAIPHARPEDGARKVCLAILVIKNGVNFGSHNDPVYVLIAFSTPDKTAHIKVMQQLANLIMEKGELMVGVLKRSYSRKEILEKIAKLLNQ